MDTKGKDTWLHAESGAAVVAALAPNELTIIKKGDTDRVTSKGLLAPFEEEGVDYLLVEGAHRKFERKRGVVQLLCAGSEEDANDLLRQHPRTACIIGAPSLPASLKSIRGTPVLRVPRDAGRLVSLIDGRGRA
jgi:molybdopterin-guanine dinucleotide biosynthesis protein